MQRFRFAHIFENYFMKAVEHFFRVYIAWCKHSGVGGGGGGGPRGFLKKPGGGGGGGISPPPPCWGEG